STSSSRSNTSVWAASTGSVGSGTTVTRRRCRPLTPTLSPPAGRGRDPREAGEGGGLGHGVAAPAAEWDRLVVAPTRRRYALADLLKGMTPEAMREAFDWGPDKGREALAPDAGDLDHR